MNLPAEIPATSLPRVRERHALTALEEALDAWAFQADQLAEQGDVAALGAGLGRLRGFRRAVADLERHIEDHAARLMDTDRLEADGLVLERRPASKSRSDWQSEELLRKLAGGDTLINPETGENVFPVLLACVPFTKSLQWRVTALKQRGFQVDEWCKEKPGRATVQVHTAEDES